MDACVARALISFPLPERAGAGSAPLAAETLDFKPMTTRVPGASRAEVSAAMDKVRSSAQ
jgi:hypothetical protein